MGRGWVLKGARRTSIWGVAGIYGEGLQNARSLIGSGRPRVLPRGGFRLPHWPGYGRGKTLPFPRQPAQPCQSAFHPVAACSWLVKTQCGQGLGVEMHNSAQLVATWPEPNWLLLSADGQWNGLCGKTQRVAEVGWPTGMCSPFLPIPLKVKSVGEQLKLPSISDQTWCCERAVFTT